MSDSRVTHHAFDNGLTLVAERIPDVQSAAFAILVPAGAVFEPSHQGGMASMAAEWIMRGAGSRDSRALLSALDDLGVNHGEGAQTVHASVTGSALGRNLIPALEIFADVLRRPHLEDDQFEPIKALTLQSLNSLEDDPGSKVIYELRRRHFPDPWGRPAPGTIEGVQAVTAADLRAFQQSAYRPNQAIIAVAGAIEWDRLRDAVDRHFGDWKPQPDRLLVTRPAGPNRDHIIKDTQQIQIALAYPTVAVDHPDYYLARAAAAILGGYASARLFTEVREKRGLCYSVYAGYESLKDRAAVLCYAGTAADRAQQTLDVTIAEVRRLATSGVEPEELDMMRAGLKTALIMQQESTRSRSAALASDWYYLGRVRPLDEIAAALDALSTESVSRFAAEQPLDDLTILTLGPNPLDVTL